MNRGVNRQPIFFGDEDRLDVGRLLGEIHERFGVTTLAYCLMSNHYHLVVRLDGDRLSDAMHHFGSALARRVNDRNGRDGPLFRGRFCSLPVETDNYLQWVVRYVHRNALDLPGITSAADHRWSSMRTYLELRPVPSFLDLDPVMALWNSPIEFARFHESEEANRLHVSSPAELEAIIRHHVALTFFQTESDDLGVRGVDATVRAALLLVAPRIGGPHVDALVSQSFSSSSALYSARSRAESRVRDDPQLQTIVDRIVASLPIHLSKCA